MDRKIEMMLRGNMFKNMLDEQVNEIRKKYGMKKMELEVLLFLADNPKENTGSDIQKYLCINKGYLSQILDSLCNEGKITSEVDKKDRRYTHYIPTDAVKPIIMELTESRQNINRKLYFGITEEEISVMKRVAVKIDENIKDILANKS